MITLRQIERLLDGPTPARLVERILANGRSAGPAPGSLLRRLLTCPGASVIAATGLALQRCCELTYGPCRLADVLAARLLRSQSGAGLFAEPRHEPSIAASAVALRGLMDWLGRQERIGGNGAASARPGIERGLAALTARQDAGGLIDGDAATSAMVLWQLGDQPAFRRMVDLPRLIAAVQRAEFDAGGAELGHLAYAAAA